MPELDIDALGKKMADKAQVYAAGDPFPHIVMDDFLPEDVFRDLCAQFPGPDASFWDRYEYNYQTKLACNKVHLLPEAISRVLFALNSGGFMEHLQTLTGEDNLISDPHYVGGGIHQIERGGSLAVHADFTVPPHYQMFRRLNLLIYLNPEWEEAYGGRFELWDKEAKECKKSVLPVGNRCVVFTTTATSFHGHPEPLTCPEGMTRRSLALYYYQLAEPEGHAGVVTRWNKRGEDKKGLVARVRNQAARTLWWVSYKFAGLAGRVDV